MTSAACRVSARCLGAAPGDWAPPGRDLHLLHSSIAAADIAAAQQKANYAVKNGDVPERKSEPMTFVQITHPADWSGSLLNRLFARLSEHVVRRRLAAQTIAELAALSDRDLADIGLHRGDIRDVARRALGR